MSVSIRIVDKYRATIYFLIRKKRDTQAAQSFFRKAIRVNKKPEKINIDKNGDNKSAFYCTNNKQVKYL